MNEQLSKLITILEEPSFSGFNTHNYNSNIELINKSSLGTPLETICCNLFHYTNDGDIRKKDNKYKIMQENELSKLILLLKNGKLKEATEINFLSNKNGL